MPKLKSALEPRYLLVYLNNVKVSDWVTADKRTGTVEVLDLDADGQIIPGGPYGFQTRMRWGIVTYDYDDDLMQRHIDEGCSEDLKEAAIQNTRVPRQLVGTVGGG